MRRHWRIAMMAVTAGMCVGLSQPPQDKPGDRPPGERPPGERAPGEARQPEDRESYKARLERTLADNKRRHERLEAALKKLSEGASVEEVRRETEGPRPPQGQREPRRNGGPSRPGPDSPPMEKLPRDEVIAILEANDPVIGERFRKALADNPAMAGRIVDRMEPMVREIKAERDPDMRKLRVQDLKSGFDLVGATREYFDAMRADPASSDTRAAADKLRGLLGSHFDLKTKMHQQEIVVLEKRVVELREELARQLQGRDKYIERRMEDVKKFRKRGEPKDGKPEDPRRDGAGTEPKR